MEPQNCNWVFLHITHGLAFAARTILVIEFDGKAPIIPIILPSFGLPVAWTSIPFRSNYGKDTMFTEVSNRGIRTPAIIGLRKLLKLRVPFEIQFTDIMRKRRYSLSLTNHDAISQGNYGRQSQDCDVQGAHLVCLFFSFFFIND